MKQISKNGFIGFNSNLIVPNEGFLIDLEKLVEIKESENIAKPLSCEYVFRKTNKLKNQDYFKLFLKCDILVEKILKMEDSTSQIESLAELFIERYRKDFNLAFKRKYKYYLNKWARDESEKRFLKAKLDNIVVLDDIKSNRRAESLFKQKFAAKKKNILNYVHELCNMIQVTGGKILQNYQKSHHIMDAVSCCLNTVQTFKETFTESCVNYLAEKHISFFPEIANGRPRIISFVELISEELPTNEILNNDNVLQERIEEPPTFPGFSLKKLTEVTLKDILKYKEATELLNRRFGWAEEWVSCFNPKRSRTDRYVFLIAICSAFAPHVTDRYEWKVNIKLTDTAVKKAQHVLVFLTLYCAVKTGNQPIEDMFKFRKGTKNFKKFRISSSLLAKHEVFDYQKLPTGYIKCTIKEADNSKIRNAYLMLKKLIERFS